MNSNQASRRETYNAARELVLARVRAMPSSVRVSVGTKMYTRDELLQHVERGSSIGHEIERMQLQYVRDLAHGCI